MTANLYDGCTMGDLVQRAIERGGDRVAFILDEQRITYREFGALLSRFIQALEARGVRKGDAIAGLDAAAQLPGKVFHAGTRLTNNQVVTSGGRVLCAVGLGDKVRDAQRAAYQLVDALSWPGMQCRRDIGYRAIEREDA